MSKTILINVAQHTYAPSGILDTLVFDVDNLSGNDAIAYVIERTIDYMTTHTPEEGYYQENVEYSFNDLRSLCDANEDFVEYLRMSGVEFLGHQDETGVSVCLEGEVFFDQEDLDEIRAMREEEL